MVPVDIGRIHRTVGSDFVVYALRGKFFLKFLALLSAVPRSWGGKAISRVWRKLACCERQEELKSWTTRNQPGQSEILFDYWDA